MDTPSTVTAGSLRHRDARRADAAGGDDAAGLVEQRDLAELAELQDVVLEDAVLLPRLELGVLQVGAERLQDVGVAGDVAAISSAARAATFRLPATTDSRVPRCSEIIDTTPYRTSGRTAAPARISAKRVAMRRMRIPSSLSVGCVRGRRPDRTPQAKGAQNVTTGLDRHVEARADGAGAFAPGQEDRRRVIDDGALEVRHPGLYASSSGARLMLRRRRRPPGLSSGPS